MRIFSENVNADTRYLKICLLFVLLATCFGCSAKIKVNNDLPPVFHLSGDNQCMLFQVSDDKGPIWKIYPNGNVRLNEIKTIKYGELPSYWEQEIPKDPTPPPPLVEGKKYLAFAVVLDSDVVRVNFTIKDGKAVELPLK